MDSVPTLRLEWNTRYTRLRTLALRSLILAVACAVLLVIFYIWAAASRRQAAALSASFPMNGDAEVGQLGNPPNRAELHSRIDALAQRAAWLERQQPVWIVITALVLVFVIVVELLKDRLPKFELLLERGTSREIIYATRNPDEAREALARLGRERNLSPAQLINAALTRPKH